MQQNPGLANPEISKIIGEQWRDEPEDRKNQWKLLAEEEKQRHQRQYPDYRYKPRRGNKSGSSQSTRPGVAPGEDPSRCPKCGGRYIATPRTPSTPFVTPTVSKPGGNLYGPPSGHHTLTSSRSDMSRHSRPQPYPHWTGSQSAPSRYDVPEDNERAISPNEAKRRRYEAHGSYHNFHALESPPTPYTQPAHRQYHTAPSHSCSQQSSHNNPTTTSNYPPAPLSAQPGMPRRTSPRPMMPPPPQPTHSVPLTPSGPAPPAPQHQHQQQHQQYPPAQHARHSDIDESLRLPPLQTHLPTSSENNNEPNPNTGINTGTVNAAAAAIIRPTQMAPSYYNAAAAKREREAAERAHARSVEAMVMSIPFVNKLRVLEKISSPLGPAPPEMLHGGAVGIGGNSNVNAGRGPVIAVEGPDARLVKAVAAVVERALRAASPVGERGGGGWEVRCWEDAGVNVPRQQRGSAGGGDDVVMGESSAGHGSIAASVANVNPFTAYLRTISDWHAKSAEIVDFVTNPSSAPTLSPRARQTRLSTSSATTINTATSGSSSSAANSTNTDSNKTEPEPEPDSESTPRPAKPMPTTQPRHPLPSRSSPRGGAVATTTTTHAQATSRLPIALLPSGFSLTLADRFACAVPIADAYAPIDHWQWMATLWRGVVGADLVVYVSPSSSSFTSSPFSLTGSSSSFVGGGGMGEEGVAVMGPGMVEVKSAGLIVVKAPVVASGVANGSVYEERDVEVVVDEKIERRLGFEVVEWVRGGGWLYAAEY